MEKPALLLSHIYRPSDDESKEDHKKHTRQLLYEIPRQRGVHFDSETGKNDDKSDIEILLRVIQNEKKKKEKQHEISSDNNIIIKSSEPQIQTQQQYELIIEFCRVVYRLNELSIY